MTNACACVVLLVAACNQVFDIDDTTLIDDDSDDDGVPNLIDNCVELANADQLDTDGDRLGDACDSCPTGSNFHDEDDDGIVDGCDNCPQIANETQDNTDGDDLGDVCDHDPGVQRRVRFDGFDQLRPDWIPGYDDWRIADDAVVPVSLPHPPQTSDNFLWNRRLVASGATWWIEAGLIGDQAPVNYGMFVRDQGGMTKFACYLTRNGSGGTLQSSAPAMTFSSVPTGVLKFRVRATADGAICELDGVGSSAPTPITGLPGFEPSLYTTGLVPFTYVDVVTSP